VLVIRGLKLGTWLFGGRCQEPGRIPSEQPLRQQTRIERRLRIGDSRLPQLFTSGRNPIVNRRQETAVASLSFSDW
jgi:hypothetical protein